MTGYHRVVVVGAGFGGLATVRALAGSGAEVTLVDRNVYSTFQPLLYQVATGGLNPGDVAYPIRPLARRRAVRFRRGTVCGLDTEARTLSLDEGDDLAYDHLVIAAGATVNHFGVPGAAEHSHALYTRAQAISLRDHLMADLERRASHRDSADYNIVVVGGGATGVETAGTLAELRNAGLLAGFPELDRDRVHVVLVEQGPELLAPFHPRMRAYALAELRQRGVDVRLGAAIREVGPNWVVVGGGEDSGERMGADLTVWAAGVGVSDAVGSWGLPQGRGGRILVGPDLAVKGLAGVYAVGDVAQVAGTGGVALPQLAQPAIQAGRHAGRQIARTIRGRSTSRSTTPTRGPWPPWGGTPRWWRCHSGSASGGRRPGSPGWASMW